MLLAIAREQGSPNLTGPEFVWQAAPATLARCQAVEVAASITKAGQLSGSEPPLRIDLSVTITGGTGRFAGASGSISVVSDFDPATGRGAASMSGAMSEPWASQR